MPRTFTLKWLLSAVMVIAVLVGIGVNFPNYLLPALAVAGWFAPALMVGLVLSRLSPRPRVTFWVALIGATLGWAIISFPLIGMEGRFLFSSWQTYWRYYLLLSLISACGAVLIGGASCIARER